MRLAHLSDLHVLPAGGLRALMPAALSSAKRVLGSLNMAYRRGPNKYDTRLLVAALKDAVEVNGADVIAVSGDLTNLAMEDEFLTVRKAFEAALGPSWEKRVVTVPGNHDIYCPRSRAERYYHRYFAATFTSDLPDAAADAAAVTDRDAGFPFVRFLGDGVALIGVNSALPRPLFHASGEVGREQLRRLSGLLREPRVRACASVVVMVHHPPVVRFGPKWEARNGLVNRSAFERALEPHDNVRLVIHGHTHRPFFGSLAPGIQVSEAGSTTFNDAHHAGAYALYSFEDGILRTVSRFTGDVARTAFHEQVIARYPPRQRSPFLSEAATA